MRFAYLIERPFNDRGEDGRITGCDVDLARHVFQTLGIARFDPVETEFAALLPGLADGRWRMTTGLFATGARQRVALFSRPIWALADGLLVRKGNPMGLSGYSGVLRDDRAILAVIRDQVQHRTALETGIPATRVKMFDTYPDAAAAVRDGRADAYASVARAHTGFILRHPDWGLEAVAVPPEEKSPAFGAFAFSLADGTLRAEVDEVLTRYLGSPAHRRMMHAYGFRDAEIDLTVA
ncbi:MAG: transporter substrate-binding domain-containing protein [Albidovulum sp.]|uniref:transporter substrate-binding domain-containing protein n=1 Tax=Albidovulum sp. TaxID=1872424 RepID=UPI003CB9AC0E